MPTHNSTIDRRRWERPGAEPTLNHQQAEDCLQCYAPNARLIRYFRLPDGLANGTWRLVWQDQHGHQQQSVLRVSARNHSDFQHEASLLTWLNGRANAPHVLHYSTSTPLHGPWMLIPWYEGEPLSQWLSHTEFPERVAHSIAENCVQRIGLKIPTHMGIPSYPLEQLPDFISHFLTDTTVTQRLDNQLSTALHQATNTYNDRLSEFSSLTGLVHSDFGASNLLVSSTGTTHLSALVDWEFAHHGSLLTDLGNLLRAPQLNSGAFIARLEDTFRQYDHPLPSGWQQIALLADSINWLYFLSRPMYRPNLFADCRTRLQEIISRLDY